MHALAFSPDKIPVHVSQRGACVETTTNVLAESAATRTLLKWALDSSQEPVAGSLRTLICSSPAALASLVGMLGNPETDATVRVCILQRCAQLRLISFHIVYCSNISDLRSGSGNERTSEVHAAI